MRIILACVSTLSLFGFAPHIWAADSGTYRPGQPYMSVSAPNANLCASQCLGDAQCKGWNFVRVKPTARDGVCELNARRVAPVPSAVSISGDNLSTRASSQLISAGTRTIKVGNPGPSRTVRVGQTAKPASTQRIVRRVEPVPRKVQPTQSHYRTLPRQTVPQAALPPQPRTAFRHSLDQAPRPARQAVRPQQPNLGGEIPTQYQQRRLQEMISRNQATAPAPAANPAASIPPQPPKRNTAQTQPPMPPNLNHIPAEQVQQSLFGSLYDDVKAPRALASEDIPTDTDAPIATVASVPTKKVTVDNLMAGPPPPTPKQP